MSRTVIKNGAVIGQFDGEYIWIGDNSDPYYRIDGGEVYRIIKPLPFKYVGELRGNNIISLDGKVLLELL